MDDNMDVVGCDSVDSGDDSCSHLQMLKRCGDGGVVVNGEKLQLQSGLSEGKIRNVETRLLLVWLSLLHGLMRWNAGFRVANSLGNVQKNQFQLVVQEM